MARFRAPRDKRATKPGTPFCGVQGEVAGFRRRCQSAGGFEGDEPLGDLSIIEILVLAPPVLWFGAIVVLGGFLAITIAFHLTREVLRRKTPEEIETGRRLREADKTVQRAIKQIDRKIAHENGTNAIWIRLLAVPAGIAVAIAVASTQYWNPGEYLDWAAQVGGSLFVGYLAFGIVRVIGEKIARRTPH